MESFNGFWGAGHVGAFRHANAALCQQCGGLFGVQFVLGRTWQGHIHLDAPRTLTFHEGGGGVGSGILFDAPTADIFEVFDVSQLLGIDALGIVDGAFGIGHGHDFGAKLEAFFSGKLGDIARA